MKPPLATFVTLLLLSSLPVEAAQIAVFGQTSDSNTLSATANGAQTATTISGDAAVSVTQLFGQTTPIAADFNINATSIDAAQTVLGLAVQHYAGSFCITSAFGCAGTNYLSGTFSDAAIGSIGGPGLVINVNNPPDILNLTSSVISAVDLAAPNTVDLGFSNLIPNLDICGTTICSFTSSFAGVVSANTTSIPEPMPIAILGMGLFALGMIKRYTA